MKRILLGSAFAALLLAGANHSAQAAFSFTDSSFITVAQDGSTLSFTFQGFSASNTDRMAFVIGNQTIFADQKTTPAGTTVTTGPLAAGIYKLQLDDLTTHQTWYSDPTMNSDGAHLAYTTNFSDFKLGSGPAVTAPVYYGWEDLPLGNPNTRDYNDLVFSVATNTPAPEPASLALLGAGLVGLGLARRRRAA